LQLAGSHYFACQRQGKDCRHYQCHNLFHIHGTFLLVNIGLLFTFNSLGLLPSADTLLPKLSNILSANIPQSVPIRKKVATY
jgi:hypothetical protein